MGGDQNIIYIAAGADLRTRQYRALNIAGTLALATNTARGIQQNKPNNGEDTSLLIAGPSRFLAGGTIAAGDRLKVASGGWFVAAASGDSTVGFSQFAVASGAISPGDGGYFDFRVVGYMTTSAG